MPRYDFKCTSCGKIRQDVWVSNFRDALNTRIMVSPCDECGAWMEKLPCAPNFTINGYNAKNGYSK
jgi:predicted nucleic acid-binding Zn ribbon protein